MSNIRIGAISSDSFICITQISENVHIGLTEDGVIMALTEDPEGNIPPIATTLSQDRSALRELIKVLIHMDEHFDDMEDEDAETDVEIPTFSTKIPPHLH